MTEPEIDEGFDDHHRWQEIYALQSQRIRTHQYGVYLRGSFSQPLDHRCYRTRFEATAAASRADTEHPSTAPHIAGFRLA